MSDPEYKAGTDTRASMTGNADLEHQMAFIGTTVDHSIPSPVDLVWLGKLSPEYLARFGPDAVWWNDIQAFKRNGLESGS